MIIDNQTARDLHLMGVCDHVATYFRVTGPYSIAVQDSEEIIFTDFSDRNDVHITYHSSISKLEASQMHLATLARLYYLRGQDSAEQIMSMLSEAAAFQQEVRYWWWYRLGCMPGRITRAMSYWLGRLWHFLLDKWKFIVYAWACKRTIKRKDNDADEHGNTFHP